MTGITFRVGDVVAGLARLLRMPRASSEARVLDDERRGARPDRRRDVWRALLVGSLRPRRLGPRRRHDRGLAIVDWHHPQWFALAFLILLLCVADAFLTLVLLQHGAEEINPFMVPLVTGSGREFVFWKMLLTGSGVVVLTLLARVRSFRLLPTGAILYVVAIIYVVLVGYELWLLDHLTSVR